MHETAIDTVRHAATRFEASPDGLGPLPDFLEEARLVLIGEASHGTREYSHDRHRAVSQLTH